MVLALGPRALLAGGRQRQRHHGRGLEHGQPVHKAVDVGGTLADVDDHARVEAGVVDGEQRRGGKVERLQPQAEEEVGPLGALRLGGRRRLAQDECALARLRLELLDRGLDLARGEGGGEGGGESGGGGGGGARGGGSVGCEVMEVE
eukprot:scaffold69515_cov39-Phaeocystis_antarctica.AAC.1